MGSRIITFAEAIAEATVQAMEADPKVFVMGEGVDGPGGIFGTTKRPYSLFGVARVFDTPLCENTLTGIAAGAALRGMRPILVHARNDFLLLTMDQIANHAAKWSYMSGGVLQCPMVIRAVIGRGWGQAAQHSQSLQATLAHFPGLAVIMPSNAYDAKGLLLEALQANLPVIMFEHRWLHGDTMEVPEDPYRVPFGQGAIVRPGTDVTIAAISVMVREARQAAQTLAEQGIEVEIVDLRSVRPWDADMVCASVRKTGRLVIADTSWIEFGISAEIAATVGERMFGSLKAPIRRIGLPACPTPCAWTLEQVYYPGALQMVSTVHELVGRTPSVAQAAPETESHAFSKPFDGPGPF